MEPLQHILDKKIIAILRGIDPAYVVDIARALSVGGITTIEVTLNSPGAMSAIKSLVAAADGKWMVGAGTVLESADAATAIDAGAQFIISPIVIKETILMTKKMGAVSIPGAYTPTEIYTAYSIGGDIIKVFPGTAGPAFIKEIRAPLPNIPLMPTGGINLDNIVDFQKAGAIAFGVGKGLVKPVAKFDDQYLKEITDRARQFTQVLSNS